MRQAGFAGRILIVGDEPWHPYERPPLSKAVLTEAEEPAVKFFQSVTTYDERNIDLLLQTKVLEIDAKARRLTLDNGATQPFDKLLIATGGRARRLAIPGAEHAHYLRNLADSRRLRSALVSASRVVCIGAGVIGLEVAASARALGASVLVLEAGAAPMGRCVSPEGAAAVDRIHRNAGVEIRYGVGVEGIVPVGARLRVACANGPDEICDVVVAAIGMKRNVELAEQAGIESDNGILVNAFGESSLADIYAAGDIAVFPHPIYQQPMRLETWAHAQNHGLSVGRSMAGSTQAYDEIPWFWSDQHRANIQVVGLATEAETTVVRADGGDDAFTAVHISKGGTVNGVTAINRAADIRAGRALIRGRKPVNMEALRDASVPLAQAAAA